MKWDAERVVWWLVMVYMGFLLAFSAYIYWRLVTYEAPVYVTQAWEPREIPKCGKELWLRIKDGC